MTDKILCLDLGGTNIKYCLVDDKGSIYNSNRFPSPKTYSELLSEITRVYEGVRNAVLPVICISSPANYIDGRMQGSSFLSYIIGEDIIGDISKMTNTKCFIENDGNCTVLGEYHFGKFKGVRSLITIAIGSGIGGGIIVDGVLIKGEHFVGGEVGFSLIDLELGDTRPYPLFGSRAGISNLVNEGIKLDEKVNSGEYIYDSSDEIFDELKRIHSDTIAMQIINLQYIIDPAVILIGGNISKNTNFLKSINNSLERYYEKLEYHTTHSKVESVTFYNENNLIGAAALYWRK